MPADKDGKALLEVHDPQPVVLETPGTAGAEVHVAYREEHVAVGVDVLAVVALHVTVSAVGADNWPGTLYLQLDGEFTGDSVRASRSDVDPLPLNGLFPVWLTAGSHTLGFVFGGHGGATSTLTDWTLIVREA